MPDGTWVCCGGIVLGLGERCPICGDRDLLEPTDINKETNKQKGKKRNSQNARLKNKRD